MKISFKTFSSLLVIAILAFACNKSDQQSGYGYAELTFSMDTVMIDAGEDVIYLNDNLFMSDATADGKLLYNFNRRENIMETIDLDNLQLIGKTTFEKEGPNSIGTFLSGFSASENNNLLMWSYGLTAEFSSDAIKLKDFPVLQSIGIPKDDSSVYPSRLLKVSGTEDRVVALFIEWSTRRYFLVDVEGEEAEVIELPAFEKLKEASTDILYDGQWAGSFGSGVSSSVHGDKLLISNSVFNELYTYDPATRTLAEKSWDGPLVGKQRTYMGPKSVEGESPQQYEEMKKVEEDFTFTSFLWDAQHERYYRFSYQKTFGEEKEEWGFYKATGIKLYLSVFDKNLDLLGESQVPISMDRFSKVFVKDGKIWIYQNMDDELGFVRLKLGL
ncbi:DUF4221 family protein [Mongoliitalea daihaiensis]|uniref:DUF4221 family protein n=1 Tax=Mongoliitalea daihaiensis TaxID=2782006 RepID=UPI001F198051|nr:DUF4221 family protein [Mongoliitalea daihaiensis]UJP66014.1 DUF4221 family protein [Mongoliitalea daihaiensis]